MISCRVEASRSRPTVIIGSNGVMILSTVFQTQSVLNDDEVALCQRVFDHVSSARQIVTTADREELAMRVIQSFQHGVKDEDSLVRLLI
ncbi:hypothetical protein REMIM1_PF00937 (plasmid) [Rhizobium etli bv. mimosae str. Mim1]|nr:hypothetical protein REMIM1_PF00937 [Rhizobium etli bv. mimosae str. Mim1]